MTDDRYRVEISESAQNDLRAVARFHAEQGARGEGLALIDELLTAAEGLDQWPKRGPRPRELAGPTVLDVRQLTVGTYRVVYVIAEDLVAVLLIVHSRRDAGPILRERLKLRTQAS